ncbi:MAG: AAA family ATPase [Proteobacteria bacterium]|nr:AAA family ATPase [Pseudomonadota bacterium]
MYLKVLEFHGLKTDIDYDDFYSTLAVEELEKDILAYLDDRPVRFLIMSGSVGTGKTTIMNRLLKQLEESGEYLVALMTHNNPAKITEAMITEKLLRIVWDGGSQKRIDGERKHEIIADKMDSQGKRILLAIDDAHKLKAETLESLKKIKEKGISILLAAHTQLSRKLSLSYYEEAGLRSENFEVPGIAGEVHGYVEFLLKKAGGTIELFSDEALNELSRLCQTPFQVRKISWEALKKAVINNEKQVSLNTVHEILPNDFSHLWVELRRLGYTATEIAEELNEDKKRIVQCLHGRLPDDDELYKTIGAFLYGLGIKMASNE